MKRRMKKKKKKKGEKHIAISKVSVLCAVCRFISKWAALLRPIVSCLSIFNMSFRHAYELSLVVDTLKSLWQ